MKAPHAAALLINALLILQSASAFSVPVVEDMHAPHGTAPCTDDASCSLNGLCTAGSCVCDPSWTGSKCAVLALLPAKKGAGLHTVDDGRNTSTWGGGVVYSPEDNLWHMYAAEMVNHCGINAWTANSRIVHATSPTAAGNFTRATQGEVFPVFSHEPNVVRDPKTGDYVMFFTANNRSGQPPCQCLDGSTPNATLCQRATEGPTYVSWATSANGPWSDPLELLSVGPTQSDTNLSPILFSNGSLVGIWRTWIAGGGSRPHLVTARDWRDPTTYTWHQEELFQPVINPIGIEDQFLYVDKAGRFHAIFHSMDHGGWKPAFVGGHAFSSDGIHWTYTGFAYNSSGTYDDSTPFQFSRRERPHLVFAKDGVTIVALSTGVQYQDASTAGYDATFTFLQPVRH